MGALGVLVSGFAMVGGAATSMITDAFGTDKALTQEREQRQANIDIGKQYGSMSPGEIASIQQMMDSRTQYFNTNMAAIDKQQSMLDKMAPQVGAAGQNLLDLLQGKASAMLAPITKQREIQRNQLIGQLSSQMGSGWAQSSAGIQAMTMFDQGTDMTMAEAQMSALGQATQTYGSLFGQQYSGQTGITQARMEANTQDQNVAGTILQAQQYGTTRLANAVQGGIGTSPINYQNQPLGAISKGFDTLGGIAANQYGRQQQIDYQTQRDTQNAEMFGNLFNKPSTGAAVGNYGGGGGASLGVNTNMGLSTPPPTF